MVSQTGYVETTGAKCRLKSLWEGGRPKIIVTLGTEGEDRKKNIFFLFLAKKALLAQNVCDDGDGARFAVGHAQTRLKTTQAVLYRSGSDVTADRPFALAGLGVGQHDRAAEYAGQALAADDAEPSLPLSRAASDRLTATYRALVDGRLIVDRHLLPGLV